VTKTISAFAAVLCGMMGMALIAEKRSYGRIGKHHHIPTSSPRAADRFSSGLPAAPLEADHATPAVSGAKVHPDRVNEHRDRPEAESVGKNAHQAATIPFSVLDHARGAGIQRVVTPPTNVESGVNASPALSNQHRSGMDHLPVEHLGT